MTDKIISLIALAGFALFLGILAVWVRHIDLIIVLGLGLALCAYDFYRASWANRDGD